MLYVLVSCKEREGESESNTFSLFSNLRRRERMSDKVCSKKKERKSIGTKHNNLIFYIGLYVWTKAIQLKRNNYSM